MSQFNEIYGLKGISLFGDIPDVDTPTEPENTELYYIASVLISPYNRLVCKADIIGSDILFYNANIKPSPIRETLYKANVTLNPANNMSLQFRIYGSYDNYYKAHVRSWDNRELSYKAYVNIPTPEERPMLTYMSTFKNSKPASINYYSANILISPRSNVNIDYDLVMGKFDMFKSNVLIGREYENLYSARFTINPTNRLICIGDVYGYSEYGYSATVNITAERRHAYLANVSIALGGYAYVKVTINDTPKHYFYGDLKKDTHTISASPKSNYGGEDKLFLNDKSMVFLEWDFGQNLDRFYDAKLESGAGLRLILKKALPKKSIGQIYFVKEPWDEYGITHDNKPKTLTHIKDFIIPRNYVGQLDILLGDLLKGIEKIDNSFRISLAIQIDSEIDTFSNSKETAVDIPALFYEYYYIPPNQRQEAFNATVRISKAYGIDDEPWSGPAKLFKATVNRIPSAPTEFYKAKVFIKYTEVGYNDKPGAYKAGVFIENIQYRNRLYPSFIKVPSYEEELLYSAYIYIPERTIVIYKATVNFAKTIIDKFYMASIDNIKAYGKGYDSENRYPHLGQERKWSGEAPHWKAQVTLLTNEDSGHYMAQIVSLRGYGKGNGRGTRYPALGVQFPWSKPAPHWKCIFSIKTNEGNGEYKATVHILESTIEIYKGQVTIPITNAEHMFKARLQNLGVGLHEFHATIYIIPDRVRVQVFIM